MEAIATRVETIASRLEAIASIGGRKTCWWKVRVAEGYIVVSSLLHSVWPNSVCDVAVPCSVLRGHGGESVCLSP